MTDIMHVPFRRLPEENLYEIAQPMFDALEAANIPYGAVGSVGLAPFLQEGSTTEGNDTYAPADLYKSNLRRPREIGDVDIELRTPDLAVARQAEKIRDRTVDPRKLVVDFSTLYTTAQLDERTQRPFSWDALKVGVTDTFVRPEGSMLRAGALFGTDLSDEFMEPQFVEYGEHMFRTYRMPALVARYLTRSETGEVRRRNKASVDKATAAMLATDPDAYGWLMDPGAPGEALVRLARSNLGLWSDRPVVIGNPEERLQHIVLTPRPLKESLASEDFLYPDLNGVAVWALVNLTKVKIRGGIHPVEHSKLLDAIWSQLIMPIAGPLIHPNDKK
ncbi:MAG: hypothetical protein WDN27_06300 [Candidatus Saccharibacteria bacterium]